MTGSVISLAETVAELKSHRAGWSNQELAEFYRVARALEQNGIDVEVDRGVTDEGDPWFVFCQRETGEVISHFAKIDANYVSASAFWPVPLLG